MTAWTPPSAGHYPAINQKIGNIPPEKTFTLLVLLRVLRIVTIKGQNIFDL